MDITILKTFLEVAKLRHFGRAAQSLFITQSAVSARIKLLEETLGVELFTRKRNNIELTPAGSRLHQHAENILKGWERARMAVALDPELSASLSVGCVFDLWFVYVDLWAKNFRKTAPDIALQIDIQTQDSLIQRLTLGVLDLAFMFDPPNTPDLEFKQVTNVPLALVSTKPNTSLDDAIHDNYVMIDWGSSFNVQHAENFPDFPAPMLRTNSGQIALNFLLEWGGSAYLPKQLVEKELIENENFFIIEEAPIIDRLAYIVYRPENLGRQAIIEAMNILK